MHSCHRQIISQILNQPHADREIEKRGEIQKSMETAVKSTKSDKDVGDDYEALTAKTFMMRMTKMASLLMMTIDDDDPYGHYDERYDG